MTKRGLWTLLWVVLFLLTACKPQNTQASGTALPARQNFTTPATRENASPETPFTPGPGSHTGNQTLKDNAMLDLTEEQNGTQVALAIHQTLRVVLDGNPATGYAWETQDLDTTLLEQQGAPSFIPTNTLKGGAGSFVFIFKALKTGTSHLRLIYHRPSDKGTVPEHIYDVVIDIQE